MRTKRKPDEARTEHRVPSSSDLQGMAADLHNVQERKRRSAGKIQGTKRAPRR